MAERAGQLGAQGAWVVHGHGGLDEVSLSGPTRVAELAAASCDASSSSRRTSASTPAEPPRCAAATRRSNAAIARAILAGERGPRATRSCVNAAAALCAAAAASSPREGAAARRRARSTPARRASKLAHWVAFAGAQPP